MPEPRTPLDLLKVAGNGPEGHHDQEELRKLSRSPHPYHRQNFELLEPSARFVTRASTIPTHQQENLRDQLVSTPSFTKDSTPTTDSGTEADDEIFVKKLPAPKAHPHKGLRNKNEGLSGSATPLLTPTFGNDCVDGLKGRIQEEKRQLEAKRLRRKRELVRRGTEVAILGLLTWVVLRNSVVVPFVAIWKDDLLRQGALFAILLAWYPLRVTAWAYLRGEPRKYAVPLAIPSSFDPAPALYPQLLPILVAFLTSANLEGVILPNLVLGIASIPRRLIPTVDAYEIVNPVHWLLTCLPVISHYGVSATSPKDLILLYPLHQCLSVVLYRLTTSSLLTAELQLLSIGLINLLMLSRSPQAVILQSVLWVGGLGVLLSCARVIRWSIDLARVPKWRLRGNTASTQPSIILIWAAASVQAVPFGPQVFILVRRWLIAGLRRMPWRPWERSRKRRIESEVETPEEGSGFSSDEDGFPNVLHRRSVSSHADEPGDGHTLKKAQTISSKPMDESRNGPREPEPFSRHARRQTLPSVDVIMKQQSKTHTSSGRPKRHATPAVRFFYGLSPEEAEKTKWLYAAWVYAAVLVVILGPIAYYVRQYATGGHYPVGWAIGYILGDVYWFRMQVVMSTWLDWAIALPEIQHWDDEACYLGWVEHLRHTSIGEANMRLLLIGWWLGVIVVGLAVVFRLSPYYEVDTRRKIFHFMMVSMFLPAIFVDPTWCSLALAIVLAIFLLLDLLRASQLPPLSKPIRDFLQPYTDGRDHQGPVVISHIFLLIGCAIPVWLSLASLPRSGTGMMRGWEIPTRELSMVSGVVCVGLGDAAASLIGRRWGRHKWYWKGGKSLEGSVAFAAAVFAGLMAANIYLRLGAWQITGYAGASQLLQLQQKGFDGIVNGLKEWGWSQAVLKTGLCASVSSLTEAVLTGGNDNVVVPIVLWTCVKSTGS